MADGYKRFSHGSRWLNTALGFLQFTVWSLPALGQQPLVTLQSIPPFENYSQQPIVSVSQDEAKSFRFTSLDGFTSRDGGYEFRIAPHVTDAPQSLNDSEVPPGWEDSAGVMTLPPWQTGWAYSLYALLTLIVLAAFVYWQTRLWRIRTDTLARAVEERTGQLRQAEQTVREQARSLERLLELKDHLLSDISHEFRTPLTLMLGPIDHAAEAVQDPRLIAQLRMARRNGNRVLRLVDQLLELSRLRANPQSNLSPRPLKPIVDLVCDTFRPYALEKGVNLTVITDANVWAECSSEAMERILMNLVSNAMKFTPRGQRIEVSLRRDNQCGEVELQVADTGTGIPMDQQAGIFDRFKRGASVSPEVPGSGIGLALVRELVDSQGGRVRLDSEPGTGTTVTVSLPAIEAPPDMEVVSDHVVSEALRLELETLAHVSNEALSDDEIEDSDKSRVLVIEDHPDMQRYLKQLLSTVYSVSLAGDGQTGLELARENIPDLIICDVMLPGKDGYEVSHELKSDDLTSHIPIIILTARADEDSKLHGLREHVDDYLTKPFNDEELLLRVANLLAVREILRAKYGIHLSSGLDPRGGLTEMERRFLSRLEAVVESHYRDPEFNVAEMASALALSVRQLQRKLKALTDQHPGHYIRLYRLNRAAELLDRGKRVGDAAWSVGFSSPAHFSTCFRAHFGCTPTEFQNGPDSSSPAHTSIQ